MARERPTLLANERRVVKSAPGKVTPIVVENEPVTGVRIERKDAPPAELRLNPDARYVVGRHDAADIGFAADEVSRVHGILRADGEGAWTFIDLGGSNGTTLLRGVDVRTLLPQVPMRVMVGDVIELGTVDARLVMLASTTLNDDAPRVASSSTSETSRRFTENIRVAARTKVPVFLLGPSGTGKTHTARRIHDESGATGAFVSLNCARLPSDASSLHSELLGHVKGAFTGADTVRVGKLFQADGGTLFLDEVESLSPLGQGFLLDVLERSGDLSPLGAKIVNPTIPLFRLVSASKSPLSQSSLRTDLAERLAEGHLWRMPLLEERQDDIAGLISLFAREQETLLGVRIVVDKSFHHVAKNAAWTGQVRQLKASVAVLAQTELARESHGVFPSSVTLTDQLLLAHLRDRAHAFGAPLAPASVAKTKADPRALTLEAIEKMLDSVGGNQSEAARRFGISRNTLAKKRRTLSKR